MEEEVNHILKKAAAPPLESEDFSKLKQEFLLFLNTGRRTSSLEKLYSALCTVIENSLEFLEKRSFSSQCLSDFLIFFFFFKVFLDNSKPLWIFQKFIY
jgi:hypothetical protein